MQVGGGRNPGDVSLYADEVLVAGFPAGSFQTNCYVVAAGPGEACVVVDPGQDAVEPLDALLAEHRLTPVAVLLTHGHFDHTFSVAPVCDGHDVPAWIHPDDREMLADPMKGLSPRGGRVLRRADRAARAARGARARRRRRARPGRAHAARRPHPGPHARLGRVRHRHRGGRRGRARRRHAVRRVDRAHRPARRRPRADAREPARQAADRATTRRRAARARRRPPRSGRERASNPFLQGLASTGAGDAGCDRAWTRRTQATAVRRAQGRAGVLPAGVGRVRARPRHACWPRPTAPATACSSCRSSRTPRSTPAASASPPTSSARRCTPSPTAATGR